MAAAALVVIFSVLAGLSLSSSMPGAGGQTPSSCKNPPTSATIYADWAYRYDSISSLKAAAVAVVVGEVVSSSTFVGGRNCDLIYTRYTVSAKTSVKGVDAGANVVIQQLGGVFGGSVQEVKDDPLMNVGDRAVFFLQGDQGGTLFGVLGGPEGRFPVQGGLVYSLNVLYPNRNISLPWTVSGESESAFVTSL